MLPVVIALVISLGVAAAAIYADQRVLRCSTRMRLFFGIPLLAIAAWTVSIILVANWLKTPGAYGPVQFWVGSREASAFMSVRTLTLFLTLVGYGLALLTVISTIATMFTKGDAPRGYRLLIPGLGLGLFVLALFMFTEYYFFPSA